ncbi:hypothetical protein LSUE1_G010281, partial [Lachnellula suecica]
MAPQKRNGSPAPQGRRPRSHATATSFSKPTEAAAAFRSKAVNSSKQIAAVQPKVTPTTKTSKKRPADEEISKPLKPTSQASRYRSRYRLTRGTLWRDSHNPEDIEGLAKSLLADSPSHDTWGITSQGDIIGTSKRRRKTTAVRKGKDGQAIMTWAEMMEDMAASTRKPIIWNTLEKSPILRLPLEVRERIYGYVLKYEKPILLKSNWEIPERNTFNSHALLRTCKQFAIECTPFLYAQNTFQALFRPTTTRQLIYDDVPLLPSIMHHFFRDIVLDFAKESWSIDWYEKTAACLEKLLAAKPTLNSLTLIMSPKKVGMSTTAMGMRANPVAFADFLWDGGAVMQAVSKLCPRTLKVLIKKGGKRFEIEVDMRCLRALMGGHWAGANEVGIQMAEDRGVMVREELGDLKD